MQTLAKHRGEPDPIDIEPGCALESVRHAALFMIDCHGRVASWSEGVRQILGWEREDWIGQPLQIAFTPEDVARGVPQSEMGRAAATGCSEDKRWMRRKDGSRFFAHGALTRLQDQQGHTVGYFKALLDGTAHHQTEAELARVLHLRDLSHLQHLLQESDAELRALLDGVRDYAIYALDTAGRISSWHTGAQAMMGYSAEEAIGTHFKRLFTEEDRVSGRALQEMGLAERHGEYKGEGLRRRKDGSTFDAAVVLTALRGPRGEQLGFLKLTQDISGRLGRQREREAMLADAQAARAEAERASQAKGEFLATISHELRTPLAAMLGWAHVLQRGTVDAKTLQHGLEAIARNARLQGQLIEDLLDMNRIEAGLLRLDLRPIELGGVIAAAIDAALPAATLKHLGLRTVLSADPGFGTGPGSATVLGDAARLQQVLAHLLNNAIKFTPQGGQVAVSLSQVEGGLQIAVRDTGQGIEPHFLARMFDRFQQQDGSRTRRHGGLGLGLAIVSHLVQLHGGTVQAHSPGSGQGTTVTVTLPLSDAAGGLPFTAGSGQAGAAESASAPALSAAPPRLDGLRVLVVDDEADMREITAQLLRDAGAEVGLAGSAEEGWAALQSFAADLIVSDIGMPGIDGHEFVRRLRARPAAQGGQIPALAFTAYTRPEDRDRALAAGYQQHLGKPATPEALLRALSDLARSRAGVPVPLA